MSHLRASALALALLTGAATFSAPQTASAQLFVGVSVRIAPPLLPVYVQPPLPGPDYIWTPGYWAWDNGVGDYYWVPGVWVQAPRPGYLWTPGYWGWSDGLYLFHGGYWGPHIGYYGGVSYGFGYNGVGFEGGYWSGSHYFYNSAVNNVANVNVTNVYNKTVVNRAGPANVSFNGGPGGVVAQPTPAQQAAAHESHIQPTPAQQQHIQAAQANRSLFASANHGAPPIAATSRPGQFTGPGVVQARGAPALQAGRPITNAAPHAPAAAPTYHPQAAPAGAPAYHQPAPSAYHQQAAPAYHAPAEPTYHQPAPPHAPPPRPAQQYHAPPAPKAPPRPEPHEEKPHDR